MHVVLKNIISSFGSLSNVDFIYPSKLYLLFLRTNIPLSFDKISEKILIKPLTKI